MTATRTDHGYGVAPRGYRLPDELRLDRVHLQVSDLDRSIEYYERVLGMRVLRREPGHAELGPQGEDHVILELSERQGANPVPRRGRLGLYHFAILLPDRAALGRFLQHLADIGEYAGMSDHFVSEAIYLTDPDGLGIEVYADRPRSAWTHSGRQLTMATEQLDARGVLEAARGEPWTGMPAGTVLGHVHLFVGELREAERFYHDALGFDKIVWNYPGALFLSAGGYHHHLGTNTWAQGAPPATDQDARLLEWRMVLPDPDEVNAAAGSVAAAGFPVAGQLGDRVVTDPWGTRLRITSAR